MPLTILKYSMVTVPHIMVGLERVLDYRGAGLERFHCIRYLFSYVHMLYCETSAWRLHEKGYKTETTAQYPPSSLHHCTTSAQEGDRRDKIQHGEYRMHSNICRTYNLQYIDWIAICNPFLQTDSRIRVLQLILNKILTNEMVMD